MILFKCPSCGGTMRKKPHYRLELRECDICGEEYIGTPKLGEVVPLYKDMRWEEAEPDTNEPGPEVEEHDRETFRIEGKILRKYLGTAAEVVIPHGVERIGAEAFAGNKTMCRVVFPDTVKILGKQAFMFCENLKGIVLNEGIETFCDGSIWSYAVEEIVFPDSTKKLGFDMLGFCRNLKSVRLPSTIKNLPGYLFARCESLESVYIPASVEKIGLGLLCGCNGLKSVTVDSNNPRYYSEGNCIIDRETGVLIAGCASSIIPEGIKEIGSSAFHSAAITKLKLPESVEIIGLSAFCGCNSLEEVILPPHVWKLDYHSFSECENLKKFYLPKSVTAISYDAFQDDPQVTFYVEETEEEWYKKVKGDYWCWKRPVVWGHKL